MNCEENELLLFPSRGLASAWHLRFIYSNVSNMGIVSFFGSVQRQREKDFF